MPDTNTQHTEFRNSDAPQNNLEVEVNNTFIQTNSSSEREKLTFPQRIIIGSIGSVVVVCAGAFFYELGKGIYNYFK